MELKKNKKKKEGSRSRQSSRPSQILGLFSLSTRSAHQLPQLSEACVSDGPVPSLHFIFLIEASLCCPVNQKPTAQNRRNRAPLSSLIIITHPFVFSMRYNCSYGIPFSPHSLHHYSYHSITSLLPSPASSAPLVRYGQLPAHCSPYRSP